MPLSRVIEIDTDALLAGSIDSIGFGGPGDPDTKAFQFEDDAWDHPIPTTRPDGSPLIFGR